MRPIIGITTVCKNENADLFTFLNYNYSKSVVLAGGTPILIPLGGEEDDIKNYIDIIDGLLLSGGEDINPLFYGENPISKVMYTSPARDEYEKKLYSKALEKDMPVLGICRGIQFMNSVSGGTLYQDINVQCDKSNGHNPRGNPKCNLYHTVNILRKSKLFNVFGEEEIKVNSFHHQAINRLSDEFIISAKSPDGIVEGIEHIKKSFVIGVQWHPEYLSAIYPEFLRLFEAFVLESSKFKRENK
ncbi:gamma-glutamyl-gamma-aminobutyrate hydrolase family protein [Clostridium felsineum]|uniref:Glutamine amidotransferase n=1 Tax=Clostridium felsineum TaxID=36839 RepID=A0A1S8LMW7_9CLOT|nr:gamma-glutamyl-gamma-aminobutyrate hydrolase family protein [Clostridium felsineum]URZ06590.1 Putative glutamine amidotransferase [Clostridium felsineum]URZ11625.1 Putative glutamine amidotransferase [Clostridium felsineum]